MQETEVHHDDGSDDDYYDTDDENDDDTDDDDTDDDDDDDDNDDDSEYYDDSDDNGGDDDDDDNIDDRDAFYIILIIIICSNSSALDRGCWIGLTDRRGDGDFDWIQPLAVGSTLSVGTTDLGPSMFKDWRRYEPNNQSISEGMPSPPDAGGERCASLVPWEEDPLIQEQGSWNDYSCTALKPFICQMFGDTSRYQLQVLQDVHLVGGALEGGILQSGTGSTSVLLFTVSRGGMIVLSPTTSSPISIDQLLLLDGANCTLQAHVQLLSSAFIGEPPLAGSSLSGLYTNGSADNPMESVITMANSSIIVAPYCIKDPSIFSWCSNYNSSVIFNAKLDGSGMISIQADSNLRLLQVIAVATSTLTLRHRITVYAFSQGGTLSAMKLDVQSTSSHLDLDGYSSRLSTYDAFEVQLRNR